MVTESSRPRRSAAVESVKRAANSLKSVPPRQKQSTPLKGKSKSKTKATSKNAESDNDSSDLSDEEKENEDVDAEEESEQENYSDEEMLSPSESEPERDAQSDYEEGEKQKRKRAPRALQPKPASAKKAKKATATATPKKPRKQASKRRGNGAAAKPKQLTSREELLISEDNKLFNCVKDNESDLQTTAEEWLKGYQENQGTALAQLINFVFRSAGCNATIDEVQVLDHDSITDTLDAIQESLKKESMSSYPLISRAATFRKFRRRLSEWMEKLFICVDEADVINDETMMETVTAWISAMSSSAFRSLRHTSTLVALLMVEQVNRMTRDNRAEITAAVKSREAEKIKGVKANKIRVKDLEAKVKEANQIKKQLDGFQQELIDTVFIHRYRDSDASIRADCIGELGRWMKSYPDQYLSTSYFRYFGWMLSDQSELVRLVALKSLGSLYGRHEYTGSIQQFTQRFLPRMTEMAVGDVDTQVRIHALATLTAIDQHDELDDEQSDSISCHIFDVEPRIRSAVALFTKQKIDEELREVEEGEEDVESHKLRWKTMAQTLTRLSARLDEKGQVDKSNADTVASFGGEGTASRTSLAVAALWDVDDKLHDWTALIDLLLYDHSHKAAETPKGKRRGAQKEAEAPPNEDYRLEADEETILLESVGVVLDRLRSISMSTAKEAKEDDAVKDGYSAMTRHLIPVMSKLFRKYKTERSRIVEVLGIARRLKMDTYVESQQVGAFESLWDDVVDQFVRHVEDGILGNAVLVMVAMNALTSMNNINASKISCLKETVIETLQEGTEGVALESNELEEEQLHRLTSTSSRITHLIRSMDLSSELEAVEDAEANQEIPAASAWKVLLACAKRGERGATEEEKLVGNSLIILTLSTMWSTRAILDMAEGEERDSTITALCEKRAEVLDVMNKILEDADGKTAQSVKTLAFRHILDMHILFASVQASGAGSSGGQELVESSSLSQLRLKCDMSTQARLASFVETQLARHARETSPAEESSATEDEDGEEGTPTLNSKENKASDLTRPTIESLQRQMEFVSGISHFVGAIRLGIIHIQYSVAILSKFGRLGVVYDACLRVLVETIREVGINEGKPERACTVVLDSLLQAHSLYCHDMDGSKEVALVNLAKMLSSALVVRGAQLAVLKKVDGRAVVNMHNRGIKVICEKLQRDSDGEGQQKILSLFKAMSQLLVSVEPREAITVKKDMDHMIEEYNVQVPLTSKSWDALRQYEKRLVTIASKSDSVRQHVEANKTATTNIGAASAKSRPKPRPSALNREQEEQEDDSQIGLSMDLEQEDMGDETRQEHRMDITADGDEKEDQDDDDDE